MLVILHDPRNIPSVTPSSRPLDRLERSLGLADVDMHMEYSALPQIWRQPKSRMDGICRPLPLQLPDIPMRAETLLPDPSEDRMPRQGFAAGNRSFPGVFSREFPWFDVCFLLLFFFARISVHVRVSSTSCP